ncbi:MAG TPA: DUF3306 domain-containing protein [Usitatibacter sp.]|nr:DUF3306 domain-containing protein [Usitatibacter sp.]
MSDGPFLSRWSRLKREARAGGRPSPEAPAPAAPLPAAGAQPVAPRDGAPAEPPAALPPVESLTPESDFTGFMKPDVDAGTRRQALKTLFADPKFNVMDGLDVYIDDYSRPDPLPAGWLEKMNQVARLGDFRPVEEQAPGASAGTPPESAPDAAAGGETLPAPAPEAMPPESCRFDTNDEVDTAVPLKESGA